MSKHHAHLLELGFRIVPPSETGSNIIGPEKPWFWMIESMGITIAVDAVGQAWRAESCIDLSSFDFEDQTVHLNPVLDAFNELKDKPSTN